MVSGWGLLSQSPPFRYFLNFSALSEHTLCIEYHVYIWQVSPQLSCGGTCQIYMWFKESKRYYCQIEHFASGETNERSFSNPLPRTINHQLAMVSKPSEYINALCQILYSFCCAKHIIACKHQPNVHSCNKQLRTYDLITLKWVELDATALNCHYFLTRMMPT